MTLDTIVAPATPPGYGGVSIVRISGSDALNIGRSISGKNLLKNRYTTLANLLDEKNLTIDSVLLTYFKGPGSYTGEDIIEISCHGNPIIVDRIISVVLSRGARLANPGEFTMRAFLNGKLDLVQAESVGSLIGSRSKRATELSNKILSGALSNKLLKIKDNLI
ncbi:MAG TPA: tRNA uridine-5-carboxymethylaminomethyl(34) synthesis GTPase MnmE, partial [Nitrospinaceae bacterium]|nr:tRNA uridine-5-carboxymethylaminomethyl(34) synthesis GTPase MnmE [Nitrospinaceae bacterium]